MFIKVKVYPGAKEEKIIQKSADSFDFFVKAKPERGEANRAVIKILVRHFHILPAKIRLIKGFKQRNKIFKIVF